MKKFFSVLLVWSLTAQPLMAQSFRTLDGDFVTRNYGERNYVKNPGAEVNAGDNVSTGTGSPIATRSTTTPLLGSGDFAVDLKQTIENRSTWTLNTLDNSLKNGNCQASFYVDNVVIGTGAVLKARVLQNSVSVGEITLVAATDAQSYLINFPCGDLSFATTFEMRLTTGGTTNTTFNIDDIRVGKETNIQKGNVVGAWTSYTPATNGLGTTTSTLVKYQQVGGSIKVLGRFTTGSVSGVEARIHLPAGLTVLIGNTTIAGSWWLNDATATTTKRGVLIADNGFNYVTMGTDDYTFASSPFSNRTGSSLFTNGIVISFEFTVPVTEWAGVVSAISPTSQNFYAAAYWTGGSGKSIVQNTAAWVTLSDADFATRTNYGKAENPASTSTVGLKVSNLPVGDYFVTISGGDWRSVTNAASGAQVACNWGIYDGTNRRGENKFLTFSSTGGNELTTTSSVSGVFSYTSVQSSLEFVLQANQTSTSGGGGDCQLNVDDANKSLSITVLPLNKNANQALFIQGPVKASDPAITIPVGYIGETVSAANGSVSLTASVLNNVSSIVLTAGKWDIKGFVYAPGAASLFQLLVGISTDATSSSFSDQPSAASPGSGNAGFYVMSGATSDVAGYAHRIITITTTTTIYLKGRVLGAGATVGGQIEAARIQ